MSEIRLLLADVDGTLVTRAKVLTARAIEAVKALRAAGIAFAITSGRPPRGMEMYIAPLGLETPLAAFNGGLFFDARLRVLAERVLERDVVEEVMKMLAAAGLDVWVYRGNDWLVRDPHAPHVDREEQTVRFPPTVVSSFGEHLDGVAKIVGVSDDLEAVARCEKAVQERFASDVCCARSHPQRDEQAAVSAARSQPYYLDVTHPEANKGAVVEELAKRFSIPAAQIATIGDMPNDVAMFRKSGTSIAMGQASEEVRRAATFVTASSEEEGFAQAIERFVLPGTSKQSTPK